MKKVFTSLLAMLAHNLFADTTGGFYAGIGSGLNITNNDNLIKVFNNHNVFPGNIPTYQYIGNIVGYSFPVSVNAGYRFNQYLSTEFLYSYSGNQQYSKAPLDIKNTSFWGSQNTFSLNAIGYLPIIKDLYLKGRLGAGLSLDTLTTYPGTPGTKNFTMVLGAGIEYFMIHNLSLDFDYINYGLVNPITLQYKPPTIAGPQLGTVDSIVINLFLLSINYHF